MIAQHVGPIWLMQAPLRKPKKYTKFDVVLSVSNLLHFLKMCASGRILTILTQLDQILKNYVTPGLSNLSWKNGSFAIRKGALHCEMARK